MFNRQWIRFECADAPQGFVLALEGTPEHAHYAALAAAPEAEQGEQAQDGETDAEGDAQAEQGETPAPRARGGRKPRS